MIGCQKSGKCQRRCQRGRCCQKAQDGGGRVIIPCFSPIFLFNAAHICYSRRGPKSKVQPDDDDGDVSVADSVAVESAAEFPREKMTPFLRELELDVFQVLPKKNLTILLVLIFFVIF